MNAVLATIIIIRHNEQPHFAGVWYQGMNNDRQRSEIIIDPENSI